MKFKKYLPLLLIIVAIPAVFFLLKPGFFQSDDGDWMIIRFSAFYQSLREGQFPVRFLGRLNYGYGYPVADFLYPGFMYIGVPLKAAGLSFVSTIKAILALSIISSAVFTYQWVKQTYGDIAAFFASVFYVYAPYHLYDVTRRGSVGEVLSLAALPFVLWQIERQSLFWTTLGIGFIILSHNTLALLFLPLIFLYGFTVYNKDKKTFLTSFILGLGLSAFFLFPAIYDLSYTVFSSTSISDYSSYFADINLIGVSTLFILIFAIALLVYKKNPLAKDKKLILLLAFGILGLFFSSAASFLAWKLIPVSIIQFPFRFLSLVILCAAFCLAYTVKTLPKKPGIFLGLFVILLTLVFSKNYLSPTKFVNFGDNFYATNEATTTVKDEYMPVWVLEKPSVHAQNKVEFSGAGSIRVANLDYNSNEIFFAITSGLPVNAIVNTLYFPGWKALINGKDVPIDYKNKKGIMKLQLSAGKSTVILSFGETPFRLFSDLISIISFIILCHLLIRRYKAV